MSDLLPEASGSEAGQSAHMLRWIANCTDGGLCDWPMIAFWTVVALPGILNVELFAANRSWKGLSRDKRVIELAIAVPGVFSIVWWLFPRTYGDSIEWVPIVLTACIANLLCCNLQMRQFVESKSLPTPHSASRAVRLLVLLGAGGVVCMLALAWK